MPTSAWSVRGRRAWPTRTRRGGRGLRVAVLERNHRAVGASVRNFGHVFVARDGRRRGTRVRAAHAGAWLESGPRAGLEVLDAGSLLVAHARRTSSR